MQEAAHCWNTHKAGLNIGKAPVTAAYARNSVNTVNALKCTLLVITPSDIFTNHRTSNTTGADNSNSYLKVTMKGFYVLMLWVEMLQICPRVTRVPICISITKTHLTGFKNPAQNREASYSSPYSMKFLSYVTAQHSHSKRTTVEVIYTSSACTKHGLEICSQAFPKYEPTNKLPLLLFNSGHVWTYRQCMTALVNIRKSRCKYTATFFMMCWGGIP